MNNRNLLIGFETNILNEIVSHEVKGILYFRIYQYKPRGYMLISIPKDLKFAPYHRYYAIMDQNKKQETIIRIINDLGRNIVLRKQNYIIVRRLHNKYYAASNIPKEEIINSYKEKEETNIFIEGILNCLPV